MSGFPIIRPSDPDELAQAIAQAAADGVRLEIRGGWSKVDVGAPREDVTLLDMASHRGVIDYDPAELVLTVGTATRLCAVEGLLEEHQQMLVFEPFDYGAIFGDHAGHSTIGGVIAAGVAGSRRLTSGGGRDHLLGFKGVSGRGEAFVAGGKVVKNVTGFDLSKLVCGSWGRLVALTEVTLKVLPRGRETITLFLEGLEANAAVRAMSLAMGSQAEVSAAAHAPAGMLCGPSITGFRLEGFEPSIAARQAMLETLLGAEGVRPYPASPADAGVFWNAMRTLGPLEPATARPLHRPSGGPPPPKGEELRSSLANSSPTGGGGPRSGGGGASTEPTSGPASRPPLWRIIVPASRAPPVIDLAERSDAGWLMDWAGGLIWLASDAEPALIRQTAEAAGGHAMLVRGPEDLRKRIPALHPQPAGVRALEARVRRAFDPAGVFETGRFLDAPDAD